MKNLGVLFDRHLTWDAHVSVVVRKCVGLLIGLRHLRHFPPAARDDDGCAGPGDFACEVLSVGVWERFCCKRCQTHEGCEFCYQSCCRAQEVRSRVWRAGPPWPALTSPNV